VTGPKGLVALGLVVVAGCTSTRPPERFPELGLEGVPTEQLCTIREGDHCFIGSIDDHYITQYGVNAVSLATYRQHLVPPGKHTLAVFFREQRNLETITAGPRYVIVETQVGKKYDLKSGVNGADAPFADTLETANWRPSLVDASTKEQVAIAKVNDR